MASEKEKKELMSSFRQQNVDSNAVITNQQSTRDDDVKLWWQVDTSYIPVKMAYFLHNLRTCCYTPFLILIFTSFGLTNTQAGLITGLRLIGSIVGNLFWGILSDKSPKKVKWIVIMQALCAVLLMCSQPFISLKYGSHHQGGLNTCPHYQVTTNMSTSNDTQPPVKTTATYDILPTKTPIHTKEPYIDDSFSGDSDTRHPTKTLITNTSTSLNGDNNSYGEDSSGEETDSTSLFFILLLVNIAATFFDGNLGVQLDATVMRKIDSTSYKVDFGRQRMFGTPSFVVGTILAKNLVSMAPHMGLSCYSILYFLYTIFITGEILCLLNLLRTTNLKQKVNKVATAYGKTLMKSCLNLSTLLFFGTMFVNGFLLSAYMSYFIPHLLENGAVDLMFDISFCINSISSLGGLAFSTVIIKKLGGTWNTFVVSMLAFALRFFVYRIATTNTWYILMVEPAHMFCYAIFLSAYVEHVRKISPDSILNTMYGISMSLWLGYGFIVGNIVGGFMYEVYGGRLFYTFQSLVALTWASALVAYNVAGSCKLRSELTTVAVKDELIILNQVKTRNSLSSAVQYEI